MTNDALTAANATEQGFIYSAPIIDFGDIPALGDFRVSDANGVLDTTTANTLRNVPNSIPANMTMSGTLTFDRSNPDRTITFDPNTDTSNLRLTTTGTGTET